MVRYRAAGTMATDGQRSAAALTLRPVRRMEKRDEHVLVSAVDPLNLAGILTSGPPTSPPSTPGSRSATTACRRQDRTTRPTHTA